MDELNQISGMHDTAVWTEISGAVLDDTSCKKDFREIAGRHAYPRICLGVLEKDVVTWLELLDKIVFQEQGIRLGLHHRVFRICNLRNHYSGLACQALRWNEILSHPLMKVLCLTYINDIPLDVIIPIDARGMRKQFYLIPDIHQNYFIPYLRRILRILGEMLSSIYVNPKSVGCEPSEVAICS